MPRMDNDTAAAFNKAADWADDNGYEIFGEQVRYVLEANHDPEDSGDTYTGPTFREDES